VLLTTNDDIPEKLGDVIFGYIENVIEPVNKDSALELNDKLWS
jgi:hypothetical protein